MSGKMTIVINHGSVHHAPGTEISIDTVEEGVPADVYWRRRLRDAEIDGCIEVKTTPKVGAKKSRKSVDLKIEDGGEI